MVPDSLFDHDGHDWATPRVLFQDRAAYKRVGCHLFVFGLNPVVWKDETWLSFIEERGGNTRTLRIVKVQDGCQYGTASPLTEPTCE